MPQASKHCKSCRADRDSSDTGTHLISDHLSKAFQERSRSVLRPDESEDEQVEREEDGEKGMGQEATIREKECIVSAIISYYWSRVEI